MPAARGLSASFVRTLGERDRIYVTRTDGSSVSWAMASYGDAPPHDLVHLVVESVFGLAQGFWGRVNGGVDPGAVTREANRRGGRDKYAAFGPDQAELQLAETLANVGWLGEETSTALLAQAAAGYRELGIEPPPFLSVGLVERLRAVLTDLTRRWQALGAKGALDLAFEPSDPQRGFERLQERAPA
jgi:hypothetical protein